MINWTCHICGESRPDAQISVRKHDKSIEYGLSIGTFRENVRYCNDKKECVQKSNSYSHFNKNSANNLIEKNLKLVEIPVKQNKKNMKAKYIYTFLISFVIVMVVNSFLSTLIYSDVTFMEKLFEPIGVFLRILISAYLSYVYADKLFKEK